MLLQRWRTSLDLFPSISAHVRPFPVVSAHVRPFPVVSAHVRPFPSFLVKRSNSQTDLFLPFISFCPVVHLPLVCRHLLVAFGNCSNQNTWPLTSLPRILRCIGSLGRTLTLTLAPSPRKLKKQKKPNPDPGFASLKLIESSRVSGPDVGPKNGRVRHRRVNVDY